MYCYVDAIMGMGPILECKQGPWEEHTRKLLFILLHSAIDVAGR